jgi:hypothetical protein
MIRLEDLTGIEDGKRREAVTCLDELLTSKDSDGRISPVITGYNWYVTLPPSNSIVTFSNIHETDANRKDMTEDLLRLGYNPERISAGIRQKGGAFLHEPDFRIRGDDGQVLPGLRVKDARKKEYLDLNTFKNSLTQHPDFQNANYLIAEDQGWEIDIPFSSKEELLRLADLFLRKAGMYLYDNKGEVVEETEEERTKRAPWADAYEMPVLLIGQAAVQYAKELPQFTQATKICLVENHNEISFIINSQLDLLRSLQQYKLLLTLGFTEELCLANTPFIKDYVDKKRDFC